MNRKSLFLLLAIGGLLGGCGDGSSSGSDDGVDEAFTSSFRIVREPMIGPAVGKSVCTLTVSNRNDGTAATGLNISLMPIMEMAAGHSHSTPTSGCVEQGGGRYRCTTYKANSANLSL